MSGVLTPLEHVENTACHAIAQAVACEYSPAEVGSYRAGAVAAAEEIAQRIDGRRTSRTLVPDPFRRCAFPACEAECLGPFCKAHSDFVPFELFQMLTTAVLIDDRALYEKTLLSAVAAIQRRDVVQQAL